MRHEVHKFRNLEAKLPDQLAAAVTSKMRAAYRSDNASTPSRHCGPAPLTSA
jgi:hypothetical protein